MALAVASNRVDRSSLGGHCRACRGATETAPLATSAHFRLEKAGVIGLPVPGVEIKLVPAGPKMELRVKGPNVTPGYLGEPELTTAAFDEEGFYKIGDAARFEDSAEPAKGLVFDGRTR